jgi:carbon-monoxide dehydrogenase small subunit
MTTRGRREVSLIVNGVAKTIRAYPMERLLDVLRDEVGLTGVKEGCGEGECGACAVLLDGALVNSCLVPVLQAESTQVMTIEGLSDGSQLHALQQAFLECGAAQCGICTPGMILAAHHLLNNNRNPSMEDIREGLAGNLCRCTGYVQICEAVEKVAKEAGR